MKTLSTVGTLLAVLLTTLDVTAGHGRPRQASSYSTPTEQTSSYSQRDPLYHRKTRNDLSAAAPTAAPALPHGSSAAKPRVDRQTQAVYSTLPDSAAAGGHYSPVIGPSADSYGPPAPVHHDYPEPIIEIIIKESNETLPAPPPPPPPPPRKKPREPVHVFYVKYKQNPGEYGKDGTGGVVFDEPIPALTPAPPPEEDEEEEVQHEIVTPAPAPRSTTTLRAIIHPDSEIAHGSEGRLRVTFGGPHDEEPTHSYGQGLKRADEKDPHESVQSAPHPSIAFPGPSSLTKRHQQPTPAHFQQTADSSVGQGRSHNAASPQQVNQYQRQYSTLPQDVYRGPFAPVPPSGPFRSAPQLQPLENPRYTNHPSFLPNGERPVLADKPPPHQRQAPFQGSFPPTNYFPSRPSFPPPQPFPPQQSRIPQHQLLRERHHQEVIRQQLLRQQQQQQQKLQQQQQAQQQAQQQQAQQQAQHQQAQQQAQHQQAQQQAQQQLLEQQKHQQALEQQKQQQLAFEQQKRQQLLDQQRQQYQQQQLQQQQLQQQFQPTPPQQSFSNIPPSTRFQSRPSQADGPSAEIIKSIPSAELHKVEQIPFHVQQNSAPFQPSQPLQVDSLPVKPESPEQTLQLLKQRQYQQQQEALLRQQQLIQQQQYRREQEQRLIQQQQEQQAFLRQRQEQEQLEHKQRQQFLQQHNSQAPDEEIQPYRVRFSSTPLPKPSVSIAPSTTPATPSSSTTQQSVTEEPKTEEPKIDLSQKLAELPDEVPDDVRQHLLSSGILKDAQIQILDYDKIGDVPIEDLPPHALANFYGAGGAAAAAASEHSPTVSKPSSKASSRSDDQDTDNDSEGSEIHEQFAVPDSQPAQSQVEMKVVRYDPTTAEGQSVAERYLQKDATQADPVVLNDNRYNRYLPLKVSGTQFPLPDEPLLRGRQVTSVVVLAPVDYDYLKPLPSDAEVKSSGPDRTGRAVEAHGVRFLAGEALRNLVRQPTTDNFRAWLQRERATPLEHQSVILLVTSPEPGKSEQSADRQIFMYDAVSEQVSRLTGELSSSFVEVAESNAKSEDLDTLAEQGGDADAAGSETSEVWVKPQRRFAPQRDIDASASQWIPSTNFARNS